MIQKKQTHSDLQEKERERKLAEYIEDSWT